MADMWRGNWTDRLSIKTETDALEHVSSETPMPSALSASEADIINDIVTTLSGLQFGPAPSSQDPDETLPFNTPQTREARERAAALDATLASVSSVKGYFRQCLLPDMDLEPCQLRFDPNYKIAFATHLLCNHIQADIQTLHNPLAALRVRLLSSDSKFRRAENYAWRCPALGCNYWSMRKDAVVAHIPAHQRYNGLEPYQHGWQLKTHPVEIIHDILCA